MALVLGLLLMGGCASSKKFYDGPERDPAELALLRAANTYVYSINGRRTDHVKEPRAALLILPGTQQLIVHLDEDMASQYGRVGIRTTFCAVAGHRYTVYPIPDMIARLWEPAVKDGATGQDVSRRPCATAEPPPPPTAAPPAAVPSTPPPATPPVGASAPAPATPVKPTPPPPPPGVIAAGAQARLRAAARTRSLPDAPPAKGLEAGATVTLKVPLKKDTGKWWYVTGPGASGWVLESELELVAP